MKKSLYVNFFFPSGTISVRERICRPQNILHMALCLTYSINKDSYMFLVPIQFTFGCALDLVLGKFNKSGPWSCQKSKVGLTSVGCMFVLFS